MQMQCWRGFLGLHQPLPVRPLVAFLQRHRAASRQGRRTTMVRALTEPIQLTDQEESLFKILTSTLQSGELKDTELRCAGGWVRDKLLGLASDDIDIAINNITGEQFGACVNKYLESHMQASHKVAVIEANPAQSKHLATATMRLEGFSLDFVNLRSETYSSSRIPDKIEFGTPLQDAERRDFTINSLFYNLNTKQVEDFTNMGKDDLRNGLIRTPLPPRQTFLDDPLRVLRALRFAARFDFSLDDELQKAASDLEVRTALADKISRERVGQELEKMMKGKRALQAVRNMHEFGLFSAVFKIPDQLEKAIGGQRGSQGVILLEAAQQLLSDWEPEDAPWTDAEQKMLLTAALLLPTRRITVPLKANKEQTLTAEIVLKQIHWGNKSASSIEAVQSQSEPILQAAQELRDPADITRASDASKIKLGQAMRNLTAERWRAGIACASLLGMKEAVPLGGDFQETASTSGLPNLQDAEGRLEFCRQVESLVGALKLKGCWDWKPLLRGDEIVQILKDAGRPPEGKQIGVITKELIKFQLANPSEGKDRAQEYILARKF